MTQTSPAILIGDLLVQAQFVTREQLANSIPMSARTGLPLGRALVGAGILTEDKLHSALRAQSLIRDSVLTIDLAVAALQKMGTEQMQLDDALISLGWRSDYFDLTNKLGQLLRDAGIVQPTVINSCLHTCYTTGLPLGRVLVLQGVISDSTANAALISQILIRDKKIGRDEAVAALRSAAEHHTTIEESLDFHGFLRRKGARSVRLGELLVLAGLVSEIDLLTSVENALVADSPVGKVLVDTHVISPEVLENALIVQNMVTAGELTPNQATDVLQAIGKHGATLDAALQAVAEQMAANPAQLLSLAELIRLVGIVPIDDMDRAMQFSQDNNQSLVDILVQHKLVAPATLSAVMRAHELLQSQKLSAEQAIFALHSWLWSRGELDDLLRNLGWLGP